MLPVYPWDPIGIPRAFHAQVIVHICEFHKSLGFKESGSWESGDDPPSGHRDDMR